ncbi:calcium homeostasis modulator protein 4-like [Erpetoichthys calabaricus]|uniref:Calcium homeostasis modulator family member 4 n=1 Tax=Erpetoichthys calabaricus TaxID=27687 RepID=A0A8C4RNJ8_ERPCA|nr:calcium homeostasis modulator protein 4-like [Erpetoichthys calabaricus]
MSFTNILSFLKGKETIIFNALVALITIGGQQLFSFFAFNCPCKVDRNLFYGLAFMGVPALILLIVGYTLNDQTWRLIMENPSRGRPQEAGARGALKRYKLVCFVCCSITGRAVVAPITWMSVTLLNGAYYACAVSEYAVVDQEIVTRLPERARQELLATMPCPRLVPDNLTLVRDEVVRVLMYQSQVAGWILIAIVAVSGFLFVCFARWLSPLSFVHLNYWSRYVDNEQLLMDQTMDQHSKIFASQHIKKFFGFSPENKEVKDIRIPARDDWRLISGADMFNVISEENYHYSLLHSWSDEMSDDGKYLHLEEGICLQPSTSAL